MADQQMMDFYKRAARLQKAREKGLGFEAPGALGRSYFKRKTSSRHNFLMPAVLIVLSALVMKGAIFYATGAEIYNNRVQELRLSPGVIEQAGGWLMQAGPRVIRAEPGAMMPRVSPPRGSKGRK